MPSTNWEFKPEISVLMSNMLSLPASDLLEPYAAPALRPVSIRAGPEFLGGQGETKNWGSYVHMNHGTLLGIREKNT